MWKTVGEIYLEKYSTNCYNVQYNAHHYNINNISIHINSYISQASITHHPGVHSYVIKQYLYLRKHNQN
jgi:hypothetical protein